MSSELDYWRRFLRTANYNIFETIEHAIQVAAIDYPEQLEEKKDHLIHKISTARSNKVLQSIASEQLNDKKIKGKEVEIFDAENWSDDDDDDDDHVNISDWLNKKNSEKRQRKRKGKRVVSDNKVTKKTSWRGRDVHTETGSSMCNNVIGAVTIVKDGSAANLVAKEVEVVVEVERDVLTKENDVLGEVSKIRDSLMQLKAQPVIAYDLLMRLEKMDISAHVLTVTEIAATVSSFAKNDYFSDSTQTRLLASYLLESWRIILDEWLDNYNRVRDTDKITVAANIVEPKSSIEAAKRTGSIQFTEGSSKPQSSQPMFDIGSRGSANAICMVAGQPAERYHPRNTQLASTSKVQIVGSSRANEKASLESQPRSSLQGPKLAAKEEPAPAKKTEVDPVRKSLEIAKRKHQERMQKYEHDAKIKEWNRIKNRQLTSGSQVQVGGSSRANNYTSIKSQPRSGPQGPKLTVKDSLDAKNKTKVPGPTEKIEEDPVKESLELAERKFHERLQKSEQADTYKVTVATNNGEPKSLIGAGTSFTKRTGSILLSEGPSKRRSTQPLFDIGSRGPTNARCIVVSAQRYNPLKRQLTSGSQVDIGSSSRANDYTSLESQPRSGLEGPKLTVKDSLDVKNKMKLPDPTEKIDEEDQVQERLKLAKRKLQESLQKSEQAKRHNFLRRMPQPIPPQTYVETHNDAYGRFVQWPKEATILADESTRPKKTANPVPTAAAATTRARQPLVSDDILVQLGTDFQTLHDRIMSEPKLTSNYNLYINPGLLAHDGARIFLAFSDIKDFMTRKWLIESIIQVWIMYLITLSERDNISVGFMDPSKINQVALDKNNDDAVSYMANAMITFADKKFILAPYYQNKHWVLLVIQPQDCMVCILDPKIPEEGTKYVIMRSFQMAFQSYVKLGGVHKGRNDEKVAWKFKNCPQQLKHWECGYYVMKLMHDVMTTWHSLWPNCTLSRRALPLTDLHQIRFQWVKFLLGKIDK